MKILKIPYLHPLDSLPLKEAGKYLHSFGGRGVTDCINWKEYPKKPDVSFYAAHTKKTLVLSFTVRENFVLARFEEDQSPVYRDSCVEFFFRKPESPFYTNLEFNCIGACLGARQKARDTERLPLAQEDLSGIERHASLGRKAFGKKRGDILWNLAVRIPFPILGLEEENSAPDLEANFYKCCEDAPEKHYLSWNPVQTKRPDFHQPAFFGRLVFTKGPHTF